MYEFMWRQILLYGNYWIKLDFLEYCCSQQREISTGVVEGNNQPINKKLTRSAHPVMAQIDSTCWVHTFASYKMKWPKLRNWVALTQGYLYAKFQSSTAKYSREVLKCSPTANARRRRAWAPHIASARRRRVRAVLESHCKRAPERFWVGSAQNEALAATNRLPLGAHFHSFPSVRVIHHLEFHTALLAFNSIPYYYWDAGSFAKNELILPVPFSSLISCKNIEKQPKMGQNSRFLSKSGIFIIFLNDKKAPTKYNINKSNHV